jgi:hypothetical protein
MQVSWYLFTDAKGNEVPVDYSGQIFLLLEPARADKLRDGWPGHILHDIALGNMPLVEQIRGYASGHYDCGGWDVIVECWSPDKIRGALSVWGPGNTQPHQAATLEEAITNSTLASCVDVWSDQQADAAVEGCTGDSFCLYHDAH